MTIVCTKCGAINPATIGAVSAVQCFTCGALFSDQHMHIEVTPASRPVDDTSRESWREQIATRLNPTARIDFEKRQFVPCDRCAAKPGAPTLCVGCLANRQTIEEIHEASVLLDRTISKLKNRRGPAMPMSDGDNYELGRADERLSIRAMVDAIYKVMDDPSSCSDDMRGYLREQLAIYRVVTQRVYDAGKKRGWYP